MTAHASISVLAYFVLASILNKLGWGGTFVGANAKKEDHSPGNKVYGWKGLMQTMSFQTRHADMPRTQAVFISDSTELNELVKRAIACAGTREDF